MAVNGGRKLKYKTYEESAPIENQIWAQLAAKMDNLTEHEYIRKHIYEYKGIAQHDQRINVEAQKHLIEAFTNKLFTLCKNRLLMGRFRYGAWDEEYFNRPHDHARALERLAKRYKKSRNTELLVDLINYAWLEFFFGTHPDKHFHATDDEDHVGNDNMR